MDQTTPETTSDEEQSTVYMLYVFELLDILPLATLYGAFGLFLYTWIAIFYPIMLTYQVTCGHWKAKRKKRKLKDDAQPKNPTKNRKSIRQWFGKKFNTAVLKLYGESDEKLSAFLKKESNAHGVSTTRDPWTDTQRSWLATMMRINAVTLLMTSGLILWDHFLILTSTTCDDKKVCFLDIANNTFIGWTQTPVTNCSELSPNDTDQVICFEFAYTFGNAVGAAGGALALGVYLMRFGSTISIFFYALLMRYSSQKVYRIISVVIQELPILSMLLAAVLAISLTRFRDLNYYGGFVEAFAVASIGVLILASPWSVLVTEEDVKMSWRDQLFSLEETLERELFEKNGDVAKEVGTNKEESDSSDKSQQYPRWTKLLQHIIALEQANEMEQKV